MIKKMIKLSMVAAVTVAGLTTTATATPLAEAIKNTELNGFVRLRLGQDHEADTSSNQQKAVFKFTSKVNDNVTSVVKAVAIGGSKGDTLNLNQANFVVKHGNVTTIIGKQTTQSPFAANNGDTVSTGVAALVTAGDFTFAGAYYNDLTANNDTSDATLTAVGAIGNIGSINVEGWYANEDESDTSIVAVLASSKVGPVSISGHFAEKDNGTSDEISNTQLVASLPIGNINATIGYATTGKDGGDVTYDGNEDSRLILSLAEDGTGSGVNTKLADTDAILVGINTKISPSTTIGLNYVTADVSNAGDATETQLTAAVALSKNFTVSGYYSVADVLGTDKTNSRVEAKYSF
jgi:hypothetical protein